MFPTSGKLEFAQPLMREHEGSLIGFMRRNGRFEKFCVGI